MAVNESSGPQIEGGALGRIAGAVGSMLVLSTPLTYYLTQEVGSLVLGKLIAGIVLLGVYFSTHGASLLQRWTARQSGLWAMAATSTLAVTAVLVVANVLAVQSDKEWDVTREGLYSMSEQTTALLGRLQQDVQALAFYMPSDPQYGEVRGTLERYAARSQRFTFRMVDPQSSPTLVQQYEVTESGPRIAVVAGEQKVMVKEPDEQSLTNAIIRVAEQPQKTIHFLAGHGEGDITDAASAEGFARLAAALGDEGYRVESLTLQRGEKVDPAQHGKSVSFAEAPKGDAPAEVKVPDHALVLVVAAPRSVLLAPEVRALEAFVARGGRLVALLEPDSETGLEPLLRQHKIGVRADIVVDTNELNRALGYGAAAPLALPVEQEHPIIAGQRAPVVMVTARSLTALEEGEANMVAAPLVETGESAWGETAAKEGVAELDDEDHAGPVALGVAAWAEAESGHGEVHAEGPRLVAFGDGTFASNAMLDKFGNRDLMLNAINWAAEEEAKISIRPSRRAFNQVLLTGTQLATVGFLCLDIVPVLLVALGLGVVLVRRQR